MGRLQPTVAPKVAPNMNCRVCHRPMEEVLRGHLSGGHIYLCRTCETVAAVTAEEAALAFPDEALTVRGDSASG